MYMYVFISIITIITKSQSHFLSLNTRPILDVLLIVLQDSPNDLCLLTNCRRVCIGLTWETRILILYRGDTYILYFYPGKSSLSYSNIYIPCVRQRIKRCLYSLSGKASYHQISLSLKASILDVIRIVSLWNLTGISATRLQMCQWNIRAIWTV